MPDDLFRLLERFGAAFPWEQVKLTINRPPEGKYEFVAVLTGDQKRGLEFECEMGFSPAEAIDKVIARCASSRDPEIVKQKAIRDLEERLRKLREVQFTFPPYQPNRELANGAPTPYKETIEV